MTAERQSAAAALSPEIQEGTVLAGRYRIGRLIGAGGMGVVFAAEHLDLKEPVAIKFLLPEATKQGNDALTRFAREAWAASKIKSEYVTRVNDVGRLANGTPFLVMEYLNGSDLERMLAAQGPFDIEQAVEFMLQACEALAEAHALGIVHRDLKPSNLFCIRRSDGLLAVKVLDFGISKITRNMGTGSDLRLTAPSATVGSPLYMSPEQMTSPSGADARGDVWGLGVILYELLAGKVPFDADGLTELAVKVSLDEPRPLRALRDDAPMALERVVMRCLEKKADDRYSNVAELARALAPFAPARAVAHAERATRVLEAAGQRMAPAFGAVRQAGPASHARLRGLDFGLFNGSNARSQRLRITIVACTLAAVIGGATALIRSYLSRQRAEGSPAVAAPSDEALPSNSNADEPIAPADPMPETQRSAITDDTSAAPQPAAPSGDLIEPTPAPSAVEAPPLAPPAATHKKLAEPKKRAEKPVRAATPKPSDELDTLGGRL